MNLLPAFSATGARARPRSSDFGLAIVDWSLAFSRPPASCGFWGSGGAHAELRFFWLRSHRMERAVRAVRVQMGAWRPCLLVVEL